MRPAAALALVLIAPPLAAAASRSSSPITVGATVVRSCLVRTDGNDAEVTCRRPQGVPPRIVTTPATTTPAPSPDASKPAPAGPDQARIVSIEF